MPIDNFNFYNPTRVLFGQNTIKDLNLYLPSDKYYIICYGGGSIKKNRIYDQVIDALGTRKYEDFPGIESNPDFETLMKCVTRCREIGLEKVYILAVGGGSVIDGCKFICCAVYYEGKEWEMVMNGGVECKNSLPMSVVLTLPASGSECNMGASVAHRKLKRKETIKNEILFPQVAVLDPDTMLTLPLKQIQNGIIDAFVHVCEQYITECQDADCQDRYAEGLMITLVKNGEKLMKNPTDYVARSNIMWAANQALNTLIQKGVKQDWSTHNIGFELTTYLGLDHGQTLSIVQPRLLEFKIESKKEKLSILGEKIFGIQSGTIIERARQTIVEIEHFYKDILKVKTKISQLDCSQDKSWINEVLLKFKNENKIFGENKDISYKEVELILNKCY